MAITGGYLTRRTMILAKIESTKGTDSVPLAADAVLISDPGLTVNGRELERDFLRDTLSPIGHIIGAKDVELTFNTEMKSSGTSNAGGVGDIPEIDPLLRASGLERTLTAEASAGAGDGTIRYDPESDPANMESVSIYLFIGGALRFRILGAVGSVRAVFPAGEFGRFEWTIRGEYATPTDVAIPASPVFDTTKPPVVQQSAFTLGAGAIIAQQLTVDLANAFTVRPDLNAADGVKQIDIINRDTQGEINPEIEKEADFAFWANWENSTLQALTIDAGATGGNIVQVTGPNLITRSLGLSDRDGIRIYDLPFKMATSTETAVDDEVRFTFK